MATLAYPAARWSLRVVMERHWRLVSLALFCTWFTEDGGYAIYWRFKDPAALAFMREGGDVPTSADQTSVHPQAQRQVKAAGYLDGAGPGLHDSGDAGAGSDL